MADYTMNKDNLLGRLKRIADAAGGSDATRELTEATAAVERLLKS